MEVNLAALSNPSQSGLDLLVKEYLAAKGYTKALEALTEESVGKTPSANTPHVSSSSASSSNAVNAAGGEPQQQNVEALLANAAQSLYVNGIKEGDASVYLHEFSIFHTWAIHSIDLVHPYLEAVSFAIFVSW